MRYSNCEKDICCQQYIDMLQRFAQNRFASPSFRNTLFARWAEEREMLWASAWQATRAQRCLEQTVADKSPCAEPSDPRRFPRMIDRVCDLCSEVRDTETLRHSVQEVLAAYHHLRSDSAEAKHLNYPLRIPVFERPLPLGSNHRYPCTSEDIRAQLAQVPEYDLDGLWAIGLAPVTRDEQGSYGAYYRKKYPMQKPVILLYSLRGIQEFKMHRRFDAGYIKWHFQVELHYGMEIERRGNSAICRWSAEGIRRFVVEHILLHEIGHHVQYQQRWRAGMRRRLPSHIKEQFAEDYALRFQRANVK